MTIDNLSKKQIRYICFRIQTELNGGGLADIDYVDLIKQNFENNKLFDGWQNFSKTWDVDKKNPSKIIKLFSSNNDKWEDIVDKNSIELK